MGKMIEPALSATRCIVSVIGPHAGEGVNEIFNRKIEDTRAIGRTFWLIKSPKAKPGIVQPMCGIDPVYVLFVEPSTKGGDRPAIFAHKATIFSDDGIQWDPLPDGLGPVTGKLDTNAHALVFDALEIITESIELDIWHYAAFDKPEQPVKMILGCSTVCAVKKDMKDHPGKMKSRFRRIVAVGRLVAPYCVWIR